VSLISRFVDGQRNARHDWLFFAYLAFAVSVSSFTGVQRVRYGRAIASFDLCAALADATCASTELEKARSIEPEEARTLIAQAEMRAMLGEVDKAEQTLALVLAPRSPWRRAATLTLLSLLPSRASTARQSLARAADAPPPVPLDTLESDSEVVAQLDPSARGELLLVLGDIAAMKGQQERARARWTETSALVDVDALVKPRLGRMSAREDAGLAATSAELQQLHDDFEKFFSAVEDGAEAEAIQARDLSGRVKKLASEAARNKLSLAINAAERCVDVVRRRQQEARSSIDAPWKPTPPATRGHTQWERDLYQRELANYQQQLERAQAEENSRAAKKDERLGDLTKKIASMMEEARSLAREGFALANVAPRAVAAP
jgi:hypothetical protein